MIQNRKNFQLLESVLKELSTYSTRGDVMPVLLDKLVNSFPLETAFLYLRDYDRGPEFYLKSVMPLYSSLPESIDIDVDGLSPTIDKDIVSAIAPTLGYKRMKAQEVVDNHFVIGFLVVVLSDSADISGEDYNTMHLIATIIGGKAKEAYFKERTHRARASLEYAIDSAGIDIYVTDYYTNEILYVNKSMAAPYGGTSNMLGKTCYLALYNDKVDECEYCPKRKLIDENGNPTKLYSWDYQRPMDGKWFRVFSAAFEWEDGQLAHVITSLDITESKQNELLVTKMALYDALTEIPNRRSFELDFQNIIENALSHIKSGYVLFLDLDNFKYINDAFGHEKGDELLIQVAEYLMSMTDENIKAYRYGGDEFIVVADDATEEGVMELANKLIERFSQPWMLGELEYFCTASIGVANYPKDGFSYDELLTAADKAMYSAKNSGKAGIMFADDNNRISVRLQKEFALRKAILDDFSEFVLMYHPIVDAKTGRWSGTEVLPRWKSPLFGMVYPEEFVPLCEEIGLIGQFEEWVLQQALEEVSHWELKDEFFLSLNISAMQLKKESFSDGVLQMLEERKLSNVRLMLELASGPKYDDSIIKHLTKLQSGGVYVAFDSFGIGNSSLESIQSFAVNFIKIDKKLIMGFIDDKLKTTIVEAIILIAHAASAKVCAEGVETMKHLVQLQDINCDYAQGVYFLEPVTADEFISRMKLIN